MFVPASSFGFSIDGPSGRIPQWKHRNRGIAEGRGAKGQERRFAERDTETRSVGMVGLEPMEEPAGTVYRLYDVFWCDSTRPVRGGTEMNSRVQLPICFSTSQWNGHRSTFVLCKARKYAHTIFIGTDCIMNRPPSSRFPDHPVVARPYTFAPSNVHQWTPTIRHISLLLLNQLFPGSLCLWTKPFHPDEIIASSPVKWCVSRACYLEYV